MTRALFVGLVAVFTTVVEARGIPYGAVDSEALVACDAEQWAGRRDAANSCYRNLITDNLGPAVQAEAYWALGDQKSANSLFQLAIQRSPDDASIRVRWGELFIDTYQDQEAMGLFTEALELEPDNAWALVGAASLLAQSFENETGEFLDQLQEDGPPGARLRGLLLSSQMALEASAQEDARKLLDSAVEIAEKAGLPQLEIYALRASADFLDLQEGSEWTAMALAENPSWGGIYAIPAYFAWITRRYREAVALYENAIEIEPDLWEAHLELGINLLRDNKVTRARGHIETAYQGDPYNPKTVNTLRLLDTFGDYTISTFPETPKAGSLPTLVLRLHEDENDVLKHYVTELASSSLAEFSSRYDFSADEPVIVELYPNHEDFVVRTTGMPGLGILGATFGYLLAMDSPNGNPETDYHWATTLWHEMAHVITLEATNHLVPRWFSEGISVYEEWRSGPIPGIRIPLSVYQHISEDKFLPIAELDGGFVRPTYQGQVITSYMQAGLICEFIEREYGEEKLTALLREYAQGKATADAIEHVLDIQTTTFDSRFSAFVEEELGETIENLPEWMELLTQVQDAVSASEWSDVVRYAGRAIELFPEYVDEGSPYIPLAKAHEELGDAETAMTVRQTYWQRGGYTPSVLRVLADQLNQEGRPEVAVGVLQSLNYVTPFDAELHSELGDMLLTLGKPAEALVEYQVLLGMNPHDLASVYFQLANAQFQMDNFDEARRNLLMALDIAPRYREAQKLLLELADARK